jgi:two-component system chemotaxis sensor kinase CheA
VDQPSLEDLNAIFRAAHSIKGGSGTFGFSDMTGVTHVLEGLLDRLRKEELRLRPEMVDAFLAAGDVLRIQLAHHQGGPEADAGEIDAICTRLNRLAAGDMASAVPDTGPASPAGPVRRLRLACRLPGEVAGARESVDNILAALAEIAAVETRHRPDAGDARLDVLLTTTQDDAALKDVLAFYLPPDEIALLPDSADEETAYGFFDEAPGGSAPPAEEDSYGFFADFEPVAAPDPGYGLFDEEPAAPGPSIAGEAPEGAYGFFDGAPGGPETSPGPAAMEGEGYGIFADAPGAGPSPQAVASPPAVHQPAQPAANLSPGRRLADNPAIDVAKSGRRDTDKTVIASGGDTSIRVSVEKVDQLINLVGELVITQAMLAEAAGGLDPAMAEKMLAGIDLLSRNTRDLQESVMSIRMLPMSMVFSRFPRVVRDLAAKLNKQVEMRTIGENTELDKGLIEKITDPLTHLVRNSLDHGIEIPEKRVAAGKNPKGTLTLKASHQGGAVVIEVMDDGGGLNRGRILEKARERGLAVSDAMSDHEVWQLIFAPGFSTADVVTDVSGRGVGMDVVKRNIEGLGGKVELESSPGFGTRTVIRLPLTLAILDGMSVGVGGETFIVPITTVVESLQPKPDDIRTLAGDSRMMHIRGEYLPLISLAEAFGLPGAEDLMKGLVVVVEGEEGKAALFVDELLGQHQVVIKSLEANYRKVPGISGATIMGDGRVALILDIPAVTRIGLANDKRRLAA